MEKYSSYKDSGVQWLGEIPSHWEEKRLKDVLAIKDKRVKQRKDLTLLSLTKGGVIIRDLSEGKGKFPKDFDTYKIVEPNDLIMCLFDVEETPRTVGVARHHGMITGAYDVFSINNMEVEYLNYYLQSLDDRKMMKHLYKGLRNIIPMQALMSSYIPVPPLEEQQSMASYLDKATAEIDKAIAQQQHMIDLLNERKQIIIQRAVTKGLDENVEMKDSDVEWIGEIPKHWEVCKLKYLFKRIADGTHFSPKTTNDGYPYLTAADVRGIGIDYASSKKISAKDYQNLVSAGCKAYKGDILIVKDGATTGRIGLKTDDIECVTLSSVAMLTPKDTKYTLYLMYMMMSDAMQKQITFSMSGAAMPRITLIKLNNFYAIKPPVEELNEIVKSIKLGLEPIEKAIMMSEKQMSLLQERKQIIISEVVTGKIKVS